MAKEMSEDSLIATLNKAIADCEHLHDGRLSTERLEVEKYYRGELPEPMHKGDSKYVSRDVFDAVDSMRSTILEAFSANSRIVNFRPEKGETVAEAKQATEYCRHVFFKENRGEDIMYEALTEALQKRFVVAKVYYDEDTTEQEYEFDGMTMEELTATVGEYENFEFVETETSDAGLLNGSFIVKNIDKKIRVEILQPEDIMISAGTSELAEANVIVHRCEKTKSELKKEGYSKKKLENIVFGEHDIFDSYEKQKRFEIVDDIVSTDHAYDESGKTAIVHEVYIHLDKDGSGIAKLWKFVLCQDELLDEEQIARVPFASFVPIPTPHTYHGENYAKAVIPIQNARTVLIRQIINHTLLTNNPRTLVLNGTVPNPNELIDNRMGGLVNVRRMDGVMPMPQAQLNPYAFSLISMIDEDKEEVTGISKLSQGLNKDAISSQNAQGMVEQLISASQQRQKIIARRFGVFLRDVYLLICLTAADHIDEAEYVDITGSYVPVNPAAWANRSVANLELTLGYGEAMAEAQKWVEIDQYLMNDQMLAKAYPYERRYEVLSRSLESRGIEDIKTLLIPPQEMKPPEPSPAEQMQMAQMQAQIELIKAQASSMMAKAESDRMKAQADLIRAQSDAGYKQADIALDTERLAVERFVSMAEIQLASQLPDENQNATYNPDV